MEQAQIQRDMTRDMNLCTSARFMRNAARFQHVFFGPSVANQSPQDLMGAVSTGESIRLTFHTTPQPLFHKNFDLLRKALEDYLLQGYKIYILADSAKQQQRLKDIFDETGADHERSHSNAQRTAITFIPVSKTVHEGFADSDLRACFFTDHQIFDRFHKYNLKSDSARAGKMALTMK